MKSPTNNHTNIHTNNSLTETEPYTHTETEPYTHTETEPYTHTETEPDLQSIDFNLFSSLACKEPENTFPPVGDFHAANAIAFYGYDKLKTIYQNDYKNYKDNYRDVAKRVGLALLYGGSYKVIQNGLGISEAEARQLHTNFFTTLSGFKKHIKHEEETARKSLQVKNLFGSIIYLDDINHQDFRIQSAVKNKLYNYPIQSIAADLIKLIMVRISEFIENNQLSSLEGNNINTNFYTRIVAIEKHKLTPELEHELDTLETGNILICLTENHKITDKWDRPLLITKDLIDKYSLELYW